MGEGRGRARCALWGGVSLGVGTLAYALFSPSSAGCSTSIVVLTHSTVTARGCAAYSVVAHVGLGLIVLGAVLLLGSFALAARGRRQPTTVRPQAPAVTTSSANIPTAAASSATVVRRSAAPRPPPGPEPELVSEPARPAPPVRVDTPDEPSGEPIPAVGPLGSDVQLPPGWYGNPNAPGKPVQWWDGAKLTDRPDR